MVSTRGHPKEFPEPDLSPSKSSSSPRKPAPKGKWAHTPSNLTLIWLTVSLPLVLWDAGYVLLRPHSMPGGKWHYPLWAPYALYCETDYIYGWKAFNEHNGFTAAQTVMNLVETAMYCYYLFVLLAYGKQSGAAGRGAPKPSTVGVLGAQRAVTGKNAAVAVVVGYSAAILTISKTLLYWFNEYFSGFENIGHNSAKDLLFLWVLPNGLWIVFPCYMAYVFGSELMQGLAIASGAAKPGSDDVSLAKTE